MINAFKQYGNVDAAVINLLSSLKINVDADAVITELDKHPDYPSLLAVSDVLTVFNVENAAFRMELDELHQVPLPCLAHTYTNGGEMVMVKKIVGDNYYLDSHRWSGHKVSAADFKSTYAGVVLAVEAGETAGNSAPFGLILKRWKRPLLLTGALLVLALLLVFQTGFVSNFNWPLLALGVFKTVGLITAVLLLVQSIDSNNPLVQVLCQTQGKTNCSAILSSKAAKVFDGLTWSEVGFYYFAGTWLLLLFGGGSAAVWTILALFNFISLPYTFYSIYHQWRVAKQWCVLCCTVQALLWLEFAAVVLHLQSEALSLNITLPEIAAIAACMLSPIILWLSLKPLFLKLQQLPPLKEQLRKFKYNAELFDKMLKEQPKYALPDEGWSIVLGNPEAENVITMVSNPYCPPCSRTHQLLDTLLNERADLQARIVFTANNDERDQKTPISRHLMALNDTSDRPTIKKALHDWYEQKQKSYEAWAEIYPVELKESGFYKIDRQRDWCALAEVTATPTLLLNGYRLPGHYQLPDLKYMLA